MFTTVLLAGGGGNLLSDFRIRAFPHKLWIYFVAHLKALFSLALHNHALYMHLPLVCYFSIVTFSLAIQAIVAAV